MNDRQSLSAGLIAIVADISSRSARERRNADRITAAAMCLPDGALNHVRTRLLADLRKWRAACDESVDLVSDIVLREALGTGVYSIEKSGDRWDQFWPMHHSSTQNCQRKLASLSRLAKSNG
jgi:hypothetical protein